MSDALRIVTAMAGECRELIRQRAVPASDLPETLSVDHLSWMLDQICFHAEDWSATKLHLWLGFVQSGMIANGILDSTIVREMFGQIRAACSVDDVDQDLIDHLDPENSFSLDIGGES